MRLSPLAMVAVPVPDVSTDTLPLRFTFTVAPLKMLSAVAAFVPFRVMSPARETPPVTVLEFKLLNVTVTFFSLPPSVTFPCPHGVRVWPETMEASPILYVRLTRLPVPAISVSPS